MRIYVTNTSSPTLSSLRDDFHFELAIRHLLLPEQLHVHSIKDQSLRIKTLVTKLFARYILNRELGQPLWQSPPYAYNEFGKPLLPGIHFNMSSSNDLIAVAVAEGPVGIDLSHSHQAIPSTFMEDFAGIFHPIERKLLESVSDERRYLLFNQLWTLKEAFTKLLGTGLNVDLRDVAFAYEDALIVADPDLQSNLPASLYWVSSLVLVEPPLRRYELEDKEYSAQTTCLQTGKGLPVLLSVVTQTSEPVEVQYVDFRPPE